VIDNDGRAGRNRQTEEHGVVGDWVSGKWSLDRAILLLLLSPGSLAITLSLKDNILAVEHVKVRVGH